MEDITTRKRANVQANRFFVLSQELLSTAGFDGYFKQVNEPWQHVLGYSPQEMLTTPFYDFIHPDDVEKSKNVVKKLLDVSVIHDFENRYICKIELKFKQTSYFLIKFHQIEIIK